MGRSREKWRALVARVEGGRPRKAPARTAPSYDPDAIVLGLDEGRQPVKLSQPARLRHAHVIGTTGSGKSNFLLHCIKQDIRAGRGVCVIDPHGNHPTESLYRSVLAWLNEADFPNGTPPIHLIDPNAAAHTIGFNPLTLPSPETDPSVVAAAVLEAFERVWGDEDTAAKPTMQRVLKGLFAALADLGLTLPQAQLLLDPDDPNGIRRWAIEAVSDPFARSVLERIDYLGHQPRLRTQFDMEVIGPTNRLVPFISNPTIRTMLGQATGTIDLQQALDDGHVILVNLAGGARVYGTDAELLGRLLTRFLFFHASLRERSDRPFFLYLDECQRYLSGDVERLLGEVRKWGVGAVLGHQWLSQLGPPDAALRDAILKGTNIKAVFRVTDPAEAEKLTGLVLPITRELLEMPIRASIRPTVVGHRITRLSGSSVSQHEAHSAGAADTVGESEAEGTSHGMATGVASGETSSQHMTPEEPGWFAAMPEVLSTTLATSEIHHSSESYSESRVHGRSRTHVDSRSTVHGTSRSASSQEAFEPVYEDRPTAFHSRDHVMALAADAIRQLPPGQAFINYVDHAGMKALKLTVPLVQDSRNRGTTAVALAASIAANSPSSLAHDEAGRRVARADQTLLQKAAPSSPRPQTVQAMANSFEELPSFADDY